MSRSPILLTPGPVTLTSRVRRALVREYSGHREPEFAELTRCVLNGLEGVYATCDRSYAAVLLTGSGTAAVESMLATFAPRSSKTLVVSNGAYGERMCDILQAYSRPVTAFKGDWLKALDLNAIEGLLRTDPSISHVAAVHHETTTGRLNAIAQLAELCVRHDVRLLLDAVSSFGAERVEFDEWRLDALAASANKCLHGVPGVSFILAKKSALEQPEGSGTVYLDARRYYQLQATAGFSPFTQSVQVVAALAEALAELADGGGWAERRVDYLRRANHISRALAEHRITPALDATESSSALRSYGLPTHLPYEGFHAELKKRGFVIYAAQAHLAARIFRVAHMGDISTRDLSRFSEALHGALATLIGSQPTCGKAGTSLPNQQ